MQIRIQRLYDSSQPGEGRRILVDRLWPRGVSKERARIDYWARSVAPSDDLRRWYKHDPEKWAEFKRLYSAELDANPEAVTELRAELGQGPATFVFSSKEEELNNAAALRDYLLDRFSARRTSQDTSD